MNKQNGSTVPLAPTALHRRANDQPVQFVFSRGTGTTTFPGVSEEEGALSRARETKQASLLLLRGVMRVTRDRISFLARRRGSPEAAGEVQLIPAPGAA